MKKADLAVAEAIFGALGRTVILDEKHMNAVTGLSGSGPAFMYIIIEALAEGGVKVGLPRDVATLLAAQTMMGVGRDGSRDRRASVAPQGRRHDARRAARSTGFWSSRRAASGSR